MQWYVWLLMFSKHSDSKFGLNLLIPFMRSWIMLSMGYLDQNGPNWHFQNYCFTPNVRSSFFAYFLQLVIGIHFFWSQIDTINWCVLYTYNYIFIYLHLPMWQRVVIVHYYMIFEFGMKGCVNWNGYFRCTLFIYVLFKFIFANIHIYVTSSSTVSLDG